MSHVALKGQYDEPICSGLFHPPAHTKRFVVTCTLPSSSTPSFPPFSYLPIYSFSPPLPIPPLLPLTFSASFPSSITTSFLPAPFLLPYLFPTSSLLLYPFLPSSTNPSVLRRPYFLPSPPVLPISSFLLFPNLSLLTYTFVSCLLFAPSPFRLSCPFLLPFPAPEPQTMPLFPPISLPLSYHIPSH